MYDLRSKHEIGVSMRRVSAAAIALGMCAAAFPGIADAASRSTKRAATRPAPQPKPTEILVGHLFLNRYQSGENLAAACRRANFKNLAIALNLNREALAAPKGEFETSAQYEQRAARLASVMAAEPIVICEPLDDNPDVPFTYQADAQWFEGSFSSSHNVWRDIKQLGTYRSRTRMGIPATIKASVVADYNVELNLPRNLTGCLASDYSGNKYRVPSTLIDAPRLKAGGRLVFLAKLEAPYISKREQPGSPTLDDPFDEYTTTLAVNAKPEKLFVIDATGKEVWSCVVGAPDMLRAGITVKNADATNALNSALVRVAANPRDAGALVDAGNAALMMNDIEAGIGFFSRAEQVAPGDPRAKAGQASGYVRREDPLNAIRLFNEAEKSGPLSSAALADRGLAYDLVGDNTTAQRYYREAGATNDEALRRLAISLSIAGDKRGLEAALSSLMVRQDKGAWRARAFGLAILGEEAQAVQIANSTMSATSASGIAPYLRYMRQLSRAQQAAAANLGRFPRASEIGRDDPRIARYLAMGDASLTERVDQPRAGNADIAAPLRTAQADGRSRIDGGDEQFRKLFDSW